MEYFEMLLQLKNLKKDKEKYILEDDPDDIIKKDVDALELAISYLEDPYIDRIKKDNEYKREMIELYKQYVESLKDRILTLEERLELQEKLKYRGDTNG